MDNKIGTRWNIWEGIGHDIKINASGICEKKSARGINKAWDWNMVEWYLLKQDLNVFNEISINQNSC